MRTFDKNLLRKRILSIVLIWGLIWGGFFGFELYNFGITIGDSGAPPVNGTTTKTWFVDGYVVRQNEWINTSDIQINDTGSMVWINVTAKVFGNISINNSGYFKLNDCNISLINNITIYGKFIIENSFLHAENIFLKNKSIIEINNSMIILNTSTHAGKVNFNGTCNYFNITNGSIINVIGGDGWADNSTNGPYKSYIPISMGGDAILNITARNKFILNNSIINITGGCGFNLNASDYNYCNAWTNGEDISGYIAAGGNATLKLKCISTKDVLLKKTQINLMGGKGGDAADGGDGVYPNGGYGGGYTGGKPGTLFSKPGLKGGDVSGCVGKGGNTNIIFYTDNLLMKESKFMSKAGKGGNAGEGGLPYQWGIGGGGGGGGYGGGGSGCGKGSGGKGGIVRDYVASGGISNFIINSDKIKFINLSINISGGNGGNGGNGGQANDYGGGGGGGYGGGSGGGYGGGGGDGEVKDNVGVGGASTIQIKSNTSFELVNSNIYCNGGNGGEAGIGGSTTKDGGGGGGGYGGGGGNGGGAAGSGDGGKGIIDGNIGSGGASFINISSYYFKSTNTTLMSWGGNGGNANNGGNGGDYAGGGGGGYGGGGGGGSCYKGGNTNLKGEIGKGALANMSIISQYVQISTSIIKTIGGSGGKGSTGGTAGTGTIIGGGGGGGYGGAGGGSGSTYPGGKCTMSGQIGDGGNAIIQIIGESRITSNVIINATEGKGGIAPTSKGGGPGGAGTGRKTSDGNTTLVIPMCLPILISPLNCSFIYNLTPIFKFFAFNSTINGPVISYLIQIDNNNDFSSPIIDKNIGSSTEFTSPELIQDQYFWRIQANYSNPPNSTAGWSEVWNFIIPEFPLVDNIIKSSNLVYRNYNINFYINGSDFQNKDKESDLICEIQFRSPLRSWTDLINPKYIGSPPSGFWQISYKPSIETEIGVYLLRCRFTDTENNTGPWEYDSFVVLNNLPEILDVSYSSAKIYRTQDLIINMNASDIETPEELLSCSSQYRSPSGSWTDLSEINFQNNKWTAFFNTTILTELGSYDFRYNFKDNNNNKSGWIEHIDKVIILNNPPIVTNINYSSLQIYRTETLTLFINGSDIEDSKNLLSCKIQFRSPSGIWINLTNSNYIIDHWEIKFTPSISAEIGIYDFRVNLIDSDVNQSGWFKDLDKVHILNNPPIIITNDIHTVFEDDYYERVYEAIDIETKDLIWTFESNALWLYWGKSNHTLYGKPKNDDVGEYWVRINISDNDDGYDEHYFNLIVININDPPTITDAPNSFNLIALEDVVLDLTSYINDVDNDSSDLRLLVKSHFARIDRFNIIFNYPNSVSSENVSVTVTDGIDISSPHYIQVTVTFKDITNPEIIYKSPIGIDIPINTNISVTFSEPMNQSTVMNAFSISPEMKGTFNWNDNAIIFYISFNLLYNTTYTVTIESSATDLAENPLQNTHSWNFTTIKLDTDNDGVPNDEDKDDDNDGYLDKWEIFLGTDPLSSQDTPLDTDDDGIPDGDENNSQQWMDKDDDNDGTLDNDELTNGTDPLLMDTDGDNYIDSEDAYPLDPTKWEEKIEEKSEKEDNLTWIWIMVIIIVIIIVILLFMLVLKPKIKKKSDETIKEDKKELKPTLEEPLKTSLQQMEVNSLQRSQLLQQKYCSACGQSLSFVPQNNRYYCYYCKKYE